MFVMLMERTTGYTSVDLSSELVENVESRIKYTEFESTNEYIEYVIEEVLYEVEKNSTHDESEKVDEEEVEKRLKSLGYLNE